MKFLVILLALIINHYWTRDRDVLNDQWFVRFQSWLAQRISGLPEHLAQSPWLYPLLVLALPSLSLGLLLLLIDGVALGLVTLLVHVAVLLALFDHVNVNGLTARYLESWRRGDYESAFLLLQERWHQVSLDNCDDRSKLHEEFCRFLLSSFFERLFAVLFWYLLLGPVGALFYHLGFLYRNRVSGHSSVEVSELVLRLVYLLEWVPARLLGLTFSLAGDFVAAFARLRVVVLDLDRSAVSVVYACALAALGAPQRTLLVREETSDRGEATTVLIDAENTLDEAAFGPYAGQQVEALLALLNRSQVIWVSALALLALYGIDS
ncbi:MAG: regulatory signaling modulator protein AmpE [Pseudomonadota bacterium]